MLEDLIDGTEKIERTPPDVSKLKAQVGAARAFLDMKVHGAAPAPYRAVELIQSACDMNRSIEECFADEDKALGDLIKSRQCKAGVYSFDLVQRRAKKPVGRPRDVKPRKIKKIGIIGAGLMASQLALLFLRRYGIPVVMKDIKQEFLDKGLGYVKGELAPPWSVKDEWHSQRPITSSTSSSEPWIGTTLQTAISLSRRSSRKCNIKQQVFAEAEAVISPECIPGHQHVKPLHHKDGFEAQTPRTGRGLPFFQSCCHTPAA